jgi:hypothetical protein
MLRETHGLPAAHSAPRVARELPRRIRGASDNRCDLLEGQVEHIVQNEGNAFGRPQLIEHNEEREADRIREHNVLFDASLARRGRFCAAFIERVLAP